MLASLLMFIKYIGTTCVVAYLLAQAIILFTKDDEQPKCYPTLMCSDSWLAIFLPFLGMACGMTVMYIWMKYGK